MYLGRVHPMILPERLSPFALMSGCSGLNALPSQPDILFPFVRYDITVNR